MEKPKKVKGKRKPAQPQHHPWDEVSLPGAGTSPTDQPTILQVLNSGQLSAAAAAEQFEAANQHVTDVVEEPAAAAASHFTAQNAEADSPLQAECEGSTASKTHVPQLASDDLVSSLSAPRIDNSCSASIDSGGPASGTAGAAAAAASNVLPPSASAQRQLSNQGNVLDIESHLIETFDEYAAPDDSVGINELPPQHDELIVGPSKIETDADARTVIEVEPAGAKTKRPIETLVQFSQALLVEAEVLAAVDDTGKTDPRLVQEVSDDIKATAEQLVNEIEQNVLEILRKCEAAQKEIAAEEAVIEADAEIEATAAAVATEADETAAISAAKISAVESEVEATKAAVVATAKETAAASAAKVAAAERAVEETIVAVAAKVEETVAASADKVEAANTAAEDIIAAVAAKADETAFASANKVAAAESGVEETIATVAAKAQETAAASAEKVEAAVEQIESTAAAVARGESVAIEAANTIVAQIDEQTEPLTTLLDEISVTLSQKVDQQLSEVTSILKSSKYGGDVSLQLSGADGEPLKLDIDEPSPKEVKIVEVPSPKTALEEHERQLFYDSLPQIESSKTDAQQLADDCKREYYQSLKKYLIQSHTDKPPLPLQTYQWEDLRRAKERGGYPWTHLYKRPLGPDEEPEIVLLLRKSQELRFASESPKSLKKVRIDEQVLVKETERYIQELSETEEDQPQSATEDDENHSLHSESISCVSDSVLATGKPRKPGRLENIRKYLKRRRSGRSSYDAQSLPGTSTDNSRHHSAENLAQSQPQILVNGNSVKQQEKECYPIMKKLKSMADRQKKRLNIRRIHLGKDDKIVLGEETKILKLKKSPKSERSEIARFIEKQDSDDVLEIVELDESPSRKRKDDGRDEVVEEGAITEEKDATVQTSVVVPDEIIEITNVGKKVVADDAKEKVVVTTTEADDTTAAPPPKKTPRLRREHVYEEIEQDAAVETGLFEMAAVEALKESLAKQHDSALQDIEAGIKPLPLDRMGSSEEEQIAAAFSSPSIEKPAIHLMAPLSSIDSTVSDEDRNRAHLSPVAEAEESDDDKQQNIAEEVELQVEVELKPAIKKEASPAPSDKKVTFSHVEDEAESHREDIELPAEVREAQAAQRKWSNMNDHEYEPIGTPADDARSTLAKEPSPAPPPSTPAVPALTEKSKLAMDIGQLHDEMRDAEELQKDLEERYLSSEATTPRTESRTDNEIHTSQVDSSALEELPLKPENRRKGFMASAQDRTRKMQAGFKNQAGKIKTKLRSPPKKPPSGSPKAKERKRFKAPEFSKMKMPEIKRPDMSKLKDFKRPEFTKFNKPDMSKFKLPEKFSTLKLRRSKSFKENETAPDAEMSGVTAESGAVIAETQPQKKLFEFNFGTYPRAFRKKKKPLEPQSSLGTETGTEGLSVIPSTETQPSVESSSSPQGDRGPGPVRSRWADKFSDVSYNDSEGSQYRRYGSEQESFDRESSLERRMKADLEETESEAQSLGIMGGVADTKQFADFDEENRAIHEISKLRAGEFKRRPMVHQDSDLRSEDSKEAVGWTDKEVEKNKLLLKAELEAEAGYLKYPSEEVIAQETLSTASSGKKVVMEEIDDDEFFLRKRGISEDNIELRQYISNAIREGYDMPVNTLQRVGQSNEPIEYGDYDIPPPKPRRLHKSYQPDDVSQELESQRSEYGDDLSVSQNGSDFFGAPKRPLRRGRGRSKYSMDSQDIQMTDDHMRHEQYFDDDEEYLRPPRNVYKDDDGDTSMNDLDFGAKQVFPAEPDEADEGVARPQPPRRRKRNQRETSMDKDSYVNGFSGRSVSNSYLQPPEDVIVYRTEHEYPIPLATPERYTDGASADSRKSLSAPRFDEDDRTSRGADSLAMDNNTKPQLNDEPDDVQEKFIIDMMENDGYAVVRKDHIPKPTPPARRKKFSRSPGERFATTPNVRTKRSTPPPARPPPPRGYTPSTEEEPVPPRRKSATSFEATSQNYEDDYEEPGALDQERPESPRNLQSGEVINKMKYRPLPPPPRPPREKRQRGDAKGLLLTGGDKNLSDTYDERIATSSTADSYDPTDVDLEEECIRFPEVEVSTQTDPLPDDFVCEEFVITDDMKVIEPRAFSATKKTLDELLREEEQKEAAEKSTRPLTEDEQLAHGLQRFRDANQRSLSERSRASSQADRSKSLSRPQTPSAVVIERRVSTPIPSQQSEIMLEAALIVRPIDDLDLEEEALRREGLLTDSSQHSKSDAESRYQGEEVEVSTKEEEKGSKPATSDYSLGPSTEDLNIALEELKAQDESVNGNEIRTETVEDMEEEQLVEEVERTMRDYGYEEDTTAPNKQYYQAEPEDVIDSEHKWSEERELVHTRGADIHRETAIAASETKASLKAQKPPKVQSETEEGVQDDQVKYEYERRTSEEDRQEPATKLTENNEADTLFEEPPLPPPRRKSTSGIETAPTLAVMEQPPREVTPVQSVGHTEQPQSQLPTRVSDLEVERLSVHALQAGQIMVSQLHGAQISADELECKAGNLVVKNIELPPGFIEGIVERVQRNADRSSLLSVETQTSRQASSEALSGDEQPTKAVKDVIPPPKPPRQRDLESAKPVLAATTTAEVPDEPALQQLRNFDEETQTEPTTSPMAAAPGLPPVYATADYLHSLGPMAFYNLQRSEEAAEEVRAYDRRHPHHHHHHHHHRRCDSSSSELDEASAQHDEQEQERPRSRSRSRRSRSSTHPPVESPQTVVKAGRQFLSACGLSLVHIINQLTDCVRGGTDDADKDNETRLRKVPTLVVLFVVITFGLLLFLLSGKSVHTHHWDYFNPPSNEGRPS